MARARAFGLAIEYRASVKCEVLELTVFILCNFGHVASITTTIVIGYSAALAAGRII